MSALSDAIAALRETVANLQAAQSPEQVAELQRLLAEERSRYEALVTAETAEDVAQDQALADAKAATDALLAEMNSAATDLGGITAQLAAVGTAVDQAPDDTPVGEVPVEDVPAPPIQGGADGPLPPAPDAGTPAAGGDTAAPAPDAGTPAEPAPAPADGGATPGEGSTPAPSSGTTTDAGTDGGAPAPDAGTPATPAAGGGPVDASGNPVDGPNL